MQFLEPSHLIESFGYIGLFVIIFAESGILIGFFFPGDSLLLTAGLFAYKGHLDLRILVPLTFVAAVMGDNVGYWFGRKVGPPLFRRENSFFFRRKNLLAAKAFYDRHGGKAIVLARFMPFIRTFAPIVAGVVEMEWRRFTVYNLVGAALWAIGLPLAGYGLCAIIPPDVLDKYFAIIVLVVIVVSVLPSAIHLWRESRHEVTAWMKAKLAGK